MAKLSPLSGSSIAALIVAAGRGTRAGEGDPKPYRKLGGRSLLTLVLDVFLTHPLIDTVLVVCHADDTGYYDSAVDALPKSLRTKLAEAALGDRTRQGSVLQGLETLAETGPFSLVLIHDAARPFITHDFISRAVEAGLRYDSAVPAFALTDTIKQIGLAGEVVHTPSRDDFRAVQTPQSFNFEFLLEAHRRAAAQGAISFTDDAALMEWSGVTTFVFEGDPANVKLTYLRDFEIASMMYERGLIGRTGSGFDVHAFGPGDHLWLGGVKIPFECGVLAHSDGDVILHALTDALLGALADGDIGVHFPPSDPQWCGASSDRFLSFAVDKLTERGGVIDHLDITLLAEYPRIGPYREAIRARIAAIAKLDVSQVSLKATTMEKLGSLGRREGIAAQATASVRLPGPSS